MSFSNSAETSVLEQIFVGTALPWNGNTNLWIALHTADPGEAGTAALVLAKPLLTIPLTTAAVASERDFLNQLPSLPEIKDGACLTWLYFAGAATAASTNFYGSLELGWS